MKTLLTVVSLIISGVVSEVPAPYPPSGWTPAGPAFELPQKAQFQPPQRQQQYLPPVDPRRPLPPDSDDADVSVQGLPSIEQQPIFEVSPINGQQYTGPSINADIQRLDPKFQQIQYQQQIEKARQFARQREFDNLQSNIPFNGLPKQQSPRQFASQTTTTTQTPELKTPQAEATTESIDLNSGETLDNGKNIKPQEKEVSVEVSKQNLQEYPPELFLSTLAQLKYQPQFVPLSQFAQLRSPIIYQPAQPSQGFDGPAHLSALPSVLAQRELLSQQSQIPSKGFAQNPIVVQQEQPVLVPQPAVNQYQPLQPVQPKLPVQPVQTQVEDQSQVETLPQFQVPNQYPQPQLQFEPQPQYQIRTQPELQFQYQQPQVQFQPQPQLQIQPQLAQPNQFSQQQPQYQPQPQLQIQPQHQPNQFPLPQRPKDVEEIEQNDQQVVYQNYQPQFYQPQFPSANQYQNPEQPLLLAQPAFAYQNQEQFYQNQYPQQQYDPSQLSQQDGQALQSGLDLNQQGNDIEKTEEQEQDDDQEDYDGSKATAVATAFGTRTQPRAFAQYGAPIPKIQENSGYPSATESSAQDEPEAEDVPAVAQATAVATGRRNSRLRSRRVRPVFTVDRSGHLVLAQQQANLQQ